MNPSTRIHSVCVILSTSQAQLGPGLQPLEEAKLPVNLARSRVVHDGADLIDDPDSFVATTTKQVGSSLGAKKGGRGTWKGVVAES